MGDATTLDKRVSSPRRKGKFWASRFLIPSLCFLIWKMGTISMAYRKRLVQCLALVLNKYWSSFPRGWQD